MTYIGRDRSGHHEHAVIIFDHKGDVVAVDQREHAQITPRPGWVEHDALEIARITETTIAGALAKAGLTAKDLAGVGLANQRETTVLWDRATARRSTTPSSGWTCAPTRRRRYKAQARGGGVADVRARTGLPLATYFSALKLIWLFENIPARGRGRRRGSWPSARSTAGCCGGFRAARCTSSTPPTPAARN